MPHPTRQIWLLSSVSIVACLWTACPIKGDDRAKQLIDEAKQAAEKAKTITADFSYITVRPTSGGELTSKNIGTIKLMKPNFAKISYNPKSHYGKRLLSDGENLWTFSNATLTHSKEPVEADGANINVWRLVTVGGFFDIDHWVRRGVYADDASDLEYVGTEKIGEVTYEVLEHKMTGTIQGQSCPFHQKLFIGPEKLVTRFTLDFTFDGKPGSEVAELTNIKLGEPMKTSEFNFTPSVEPARESTTTEATTTEATTKN